MGYWEDRQTGTRALDGGSRLHKMDGRFDPYASFRPF
jgi:hypothetical protein